MIVCSFLTFIDTQKLFPKHGEFGNIIPSYKINDTPF